jgi:hypothetical protein
MSSEIKQIPKNIWKEFNEYWDKTEYKDLTVADIKKHLGNGKYMYVPLPKDVTSKLESKIWHMRIAEYREKSKPFGGYAVSFKGDKTTLEELFGDEPIATTAMTKKLHEYVKAKKSGK